MRRFGNMIRSFGLDDWLISLTGIVALILSLLNLIGWVQISSNALMQIAVACIGLLLSTIVIQTKRQDISFKNTVSKVEKIVGGRLEISEFPKSEYAFEYMAQRMYAAKTSIDHISIYDVPRWPRTISNFEKAYEYVIRSDQIRVRYIADLSDDVRMKRVRKFLANPQVSRYFVSSVDANVTSIPVINFMIIDGEEVIIAVPGFGEQDALMSIKNPGYVTAFKQYFDLIWSKASPFDRDTVMQPTSRKLGL